MLLASQKSARALTPIIEQLPEIAEEVMVECDRQRRDGIDVFARSVRTRWCDCLAALGSDPSQLLTIQRSLAAAAERTDRQTDRQGRLLSRSSQPDPTQRQGGSECV